MCRHLLFYAISSREFIKFMYDCLKMVCPQIVAVLVEADHRDAACYLVDPNLLTKIGGWQVKPLDPGRQLLMYSDRSQTEHLLQQLPSDSYICPSNVLHTDKWYVGLARGFQVVREGAGCSPRTHGTVRAAWCVSNAYPYEGRGRRRKKMDVEQVE